MVWFFHYLYTEYHAIFSCQIEIKGVAMRSSILILSLSPERHDTMQHKSLVKALEKAGAVVIQVEGRKKFFKAKKGNKEVQWHTQDGFDVKTNEFTPDKPSVSVCCTKGADTDAQIDYSSDRFYDTIKQVVAALA